MQQNLIIAGMLIGGLGLFMLAVTMITDGLKILCQRNGAFHGELASLYGFHHV